MGGPSTASLKFAFWLVCVTFLLHCLMLPTFVTGLAERTYKENRGVRRTGLIPREAYVPTSIKSKRFNRGLCGLECVVKKWCRSFNADESTGKCELFGNDPGGSLDDDPNWSYFSTISVSNENRCILLIGGYVDSDTPPVEYYSPIEGVECDVDIIGKMSTERINGETYYTSACYLSSTEEIVIREKGADKPPMVYGLKDGSATPLPLPHSGYITHNTAASVGPSKCLSCGGFDGGSAVNNCYQFDPSLDGSKWTPIAPMPYESYDFASVSLTANDFYVIGGIDQTVPGKMLDQVYRFDVSNGTWHNETSMPTKRFHHAAAPLSETEFIVCGGTTDQPRLIWSCEIYDTVRKIWNTTGSLKEGRREFAMVTLAGDTYALSGFNGTKMKTVEKYDRATGEWKMAKALKHGGRRTFIGLGVFKPWF